ncbi:MAG: hypothetical protein MEP57_05225 [Microvirga sp.]|nr:hypothetical protein [Microvirga sp.]
MTDAVAGPAGVAATSASAVLHRSERAARLVGALDFALKAMREDATPDFAAQIETGRAAPSPTPAEPAPAPVAQPPAPSIPMRPVVIRAQTPRVEPAALTVPDGPLDLMRWSRGVAPPDELAQLAASLDAQQPRPLAPDVAALARADENRMPRDVLEVLRERHLGIMSGRDVR